MGNPAEVEEKAALRRAMRLRLARLRPEESLAAGQALDDRLGLDPAWRRARWIALFVARADEISTAPLLERACAGSRLVLPRVGLDRALEFCPVADLDALSSGAFGILEPPPAAPAVRLDERDLVVLPGLAFDREGGRLGRGGGYYDRALARPLDLRRRPFLVGVGHWFQLIDRVPMTSLDVRVDLVATDREWVEIAGPRGGRD